MRRENPQIMMNNSRLRDYTSYQTTRMIMGDFHYLAGSSGYVVADPDGQVLSPEPYGGNITQGMQEINSMQLVEQVFRGR